MLKKMLCLLSIASLLAFSNAQTFAIDADTVERVKAAAAQGNAEAQYLLGVMYDKGRCVEQNCAKARKWWEKAAAQGNSKSQIMLGAIYSQGQGVRQNKQTAKEWYSKACNNGYQRGCDAYRELNEAGF